MNKLLRGALGLFMLAMFSIASAANTGAEVENAWVREAPPGAKAMAGYMVVKNPTDMPKILVGASSPDFDSVMLHRTIIEGGVAKMVHQMAITIPAKGEVTFAPDGYHVMLMGPRRAYKAGDKIEVDLRFKDGEMLKVIHEVRKGDSGKTMEHGMGGMSM